MPMVLPVPSSPPPRAAIAPVRALPDPTHTQSSESSFEDELAASQAPEVERNTHDEQGCNPKRPAPAKSAASADDGDAKSFDQDHVAEQDSVQPVANDAASQQSNPVTENDGATNVVATPQPTESSAPHAPDATAQPATGSPQASTTAATNQTQPVGAASAVLPNVPPLPAIQSESAVGNTGQHVVNGADQQPPQSVSVQVANTTVVSADTSAISESTSPIAPAPPQNGAKPPIRDRQPTRTQPAFDDSPQRVAQAGDEQRADGTSPFARPAGTGPAVNAPPADPSTTSQPVNAPVQSDLRPGSSRPSVTQDETAQPAANKSGAPGKTQSSVESQIQSAPAQQAPAAARAMQIDAAVRLENATGQPATMQDSPLITAHAPLPNHLASAASRLHADGTLPQSSQFAAPFDDSHSPAQIVRGLAAMLNQRGGVMNMRLDPPELGQLRVQMTLTGPNVSADFQAGTQQAQALLDRNMTALRSALESQGLTVDRLTVHLAPATPGNGQQFMRDDGNSGSNGQFQRHDHNAAGGESRGRRDQQDQRNPQHFPAADFSTLFSANLLSDAA